MWGLWKGWSLVALHWTSWGARAQEEELVTENDFLVRSTGFSGTFINCFSAVSLYGQALHLVCKYVIHIVKIALYIYGYDIVQNSLSSLGNKM